MDIKTFREQLVAWYEGNKRDLPWRRTRDPYPIWVSEVMLQQTQVNTVIPYYESFLKRFPSIKHLSEAHVQTVLKQWEGLGYYARARNLHRAARMVMDRFGGHVPDTLENVLKLSGVGAYIGAAIMSIAFDRAHAVVDGNVKRVLSRLYENITPVNEARAYGVFARRAEKLLDHNRPGIYNQAVMELGALICKPLHPLCRECPVTLSCKAYHHGSTADFPFRKKRRPIPVYQIATGVIFHNDRILITQRPLNGLLGGLWEFPGGKVKKHETAADACQREIMEETGVSIDIVSRLTRVRHAYTHFKIIMDVFICRYRSGEITLSGPVDHRWINIDDIRGFPIPKANLKFIPLLQNITGKRTATPI